MGLEDHIIAEIKQIINVGNLEDLKFYWVEFLQNIEAEAEQKIAWDYIFQKIYIHAALKKQHVICEWLLTLYPLFDPITQIALKHVFPYARYLLNK